ncbi:RidA family protein [[Eubacterium] hominis]|uniref:RidA family protein n=1 Tax=[Eubacterium] hominis TaxID=2764325 RepID=UPI003A4D7A49
MNIFIKAVKPENAPKALGPYSPATKLGDFVFLSGQVPLDPKTGEVVGTTIEEQTHQVMKNIGAVLADMGLAYKHIIKTTIFVADLNDFDKLNEVYGSYLEEPFPARSCVQVARLPKDVKVEIECMVIDTLVYEQQYAAQQGGCSSCGGGCDGGCC